jgi:site-specific recombinase XerD
VVFVKLFYYINYLKTVNVDNVWDVDNMRRNSENIRILTIQEVASLLRVHRTTIKSFNRAWWVTLKEAGIKDFHFHDLRHTFASNLLLSGASLKDVKEMIGHKDITMTDRYAHLTLAHKLQQQKQLAEHYRNNASGVGNK